MDVNALIDSIECANSFPLDFNNKYISDVFVLLISEVNREFALKFMERAISDGYIIKLDECDIISLDVNQEMHFKYCNINSISIDCHNRSPFNVIQYFYSCIIYKIEFYNVRKTEISKEELIESIRTNIRMTRTIVSEIIIN